ncbi:MAG: phosphatase PAP2 family protein [Acidimicrobiales bacterium]
MLVLAVAALVTLVVGAAVGAVAWRWPHADPVSEAGAEAVAPAEGALSPEGVTILGLSAAAVAVVLGGVAVGVLFLLVRTRTGFGVIDLGPARWAARQATPASTNVLRVLTYLGSTVVVLPLVMVVGVVEARRVANRALPLFLLLVVGGELALANLIKAVVGRARPDLNPLAGFSAPSFPSGHTATAAAAFAALALLVGRRRPPSTRAVLAAAAAGLTALVACSRVLLGVHWTTDVLAGASLGWGWAALCSIAFGGRLLRFGAPLDQAEADRSTLGP